MAALIDEGEGANTRKELGVHSAGKAVRLILLTSFLMVVGCGGGPAKPTIEKETYDKVWAKLIQLAKAKKSSGKEANKVLEEFKISHKDWDTATQFYGTPPEYAKAMQDETAAMMKGGGKGIPKGSNPPPVPPR